MYGVDFVSCIRKKKHNVNGFMVTFFTWILVSKNVAGLPHNSKSLPNVADIHDGDVESNVHWWSESGSVHDLESAGWFGVDKWLQVGSDLQSVFSFCSEHWNFIAQNNVYTRRDISWDQRPSG